MSKFIIKRHDTSPAISARLVDDASNPVPIVGATVVFNMRTISGAAIISRAAVTVVAAETGDVRYSWQSSDTSTSGTYQAEFEVTFADGKVETFPKSDDDFSNFISIVIPDDVA